MLLFFLSIVSGIVSSLQDESSLGSFVFWHLFSVCAPGQVLALSRDTSEAAGMQKPGQADPSHPFLTNQEGINPFPAGGNDPSARLAPPAILAKLWQEGRKGCASPNPWTELI